MYYCKMFLWYKSYACKGSLLFDWKWYIYYEGNCNFYKERYHTYNTKIMAGFLVNFPNFEQLRKSFNRIIHVLQTWFDYNIYSNFNTFYLFVSHKFLLTRVFCPFFRKEWTWGTMLFDTLMIYVVVPMHSLIQLKKAT